LVEFDNSSFFIRRYASILLLLLKSMLVYGHDLLHYWNLRAVDFRTTPF